MGPIKIEFISVDSNDCNNNIIIEIINHRMYYFYNQVIRFMIKVYNIRKYGNMDKNKVLISMKFLLLGYELKYPD